MKRYTGQKALYEAISRSRAKAKRGSILERLRPETTGPEKPAPQEGQSQVGPVEAPAETTPPAAKEPQRPPLEKPREPVIVRENAKLRRLATAERVEVPPEKPVPPPARPRFVEKTDRPAPPPGLVQRWWRLKPLQLNDGRVEVSVPYHIGIAVALAVILVILAAFRIGQKHPGAKAKASVSAKTSAQVSPQNAAAAPDARTTQANTSAAPSSAAEPAQQQGDHWIVLTRYKQRADLDLVKEYFGKNGIELTVVPLADARNVFAERQLNADVLPKGDGFLLVTSNLFSNPGKPDTDGYKMVQKIAEVGKKYKAPPGREPFAPNFFSDAYGMKISKVTQ